MTKPDITEFMSNAREAEAAINRTNATGMHQCITCKWWGSRNPWSFADWSDDNPGQRVCALTETYRAGRLVNGQLVHDDERKAVAVGGESSILVTTADFGCVQHEPRDEPEAAP